MDRKGQTLAAGIPLTAFASCRWTPLPHGRGRREQAPASIATHHPLGQIVAHIGIFRD